LRWWCAHLLGQARREQRLALRLRMNAVILHCVDARFTRVPQRYTWIDKVPESPPALCAFCLRLPFVLQPTAAKRPNFLRAYGAFCLRRCKS
jgi:hypothetical protein